MKPLYDIIIVGAGPAGTAAAHAAAPGGASICIIDDNPLAGGQIWRGGPQQQKDRRARALWDAVTRAPNVRLLTGTRVLYSPAPGELLVQRDAAACAGDHPGDGASALVLRYQRLIIATGARERLLPFPGWTLPGVTGAGGLQALAKGGYPVEGKRVVVAGSGPLLLAVAETLGARGAHIAAIVEQAPRRTLAKFALGLLPTPSKLVQAMQLASSLRAVPYHTGAWVRAALGDGRVQHVELNDGRQIECDYLACGYGLLPNTELAKALGCTVEQGAVKVDEWQRTSVPEIYCAGEGTGIGGVDLALAEGGIAGLHASGQAAAGRASIVVRAPLGERHRWRRFAARLARAFVLRAEVAQLAKDETIICRCEDVTHGELKAHASWRSAKLHTRCGMGPCQGRICGAATETLYGWQPDTVRIPISPARAGSIIATITEETTA
jgi:NADPH-dependent 2,4-dienoyl-CoA reductase/sulfur reductase-like enzyme